jgi:hypothetical protein
MDRWLRPLPRLVKDNIQILLASGMRCRFQLPKKLPEIVAGPQYLQVRVLLQVVEVSPTLEIAGRAGLCQQLHGTGRMLLGQPEQAGRRQRGIAGNCLQAKGIHTS